MRTGGASNTDSWTRVTNDSLGRTTEVATFGGATLPPSTGTTATASGTVTTVYDANFTTVTDQAGKLRRSMVDALGRLIRVDEPDGSNNLGSTAAPVQPTSYAYDVFGNLTTVTQGSQIRTFTYDSLSRLRQATNPESGTVSYQYDDNGNLLVKTDARTVSTHFEYDALNRITRRWNNGSNAIASTTHNSPALLAGVGATNEARFKYDAALVTTGAPIYTVGSAKGRLVAQTYGSGTNGDYYAYDALGRATLKIQQTGTVNYQLSASYTLTGAISTLTYPSGHTVTNTFDQAGRLTGMSGNLGGANRTYSNNTTYSPIGGITKEQFGTNTPLYHKSFYNSRGQLFDTRVSSVNDLWDWNRGRLFMY
jgi:YD repeat-containing protein